MQLEEQTWSIVLHWVTLGRLPTSLCLMREPRRVGQRPEWDDTNGPTQWPDKALLFQGVVGWSVWTLASCFCFLWWIFRVMGWSTYLPGPHRYPGEPSLSLHGAPSHRETLSPAIRGCGWGSCVLCLPLRVGAGTRKSIGILFYMFCILFYILNYFIFTCLHSWEIFHFFSFAEQK